MAFPTATTAALIAFASALAGCSGGGAGSDGGSDSYPNAYMLGTYGVPDGFVLMDEDSDYWDGAADQYGLESNPGYADPESFEAGEGDDDDGAIPVPTRLYVAVYVNESGSNEFGFPEMIISLAAEMSSEQEVQEAMDQEDVCEESDDVDEDNFFILVDGRYVAMVLALAEDVGAEIQQSGSEMRAATGAEPFCGDDDSGA